MNLIFTGIILLVLAALIALAQWSVAGALVVTGVGCIILGLVVGERLDSFRR